MIPALVPGAGKSIQSAPASISLLITSLVSYAAKGSPSTFSSIPSSHLPANKKISSPHISFTNLVASITSSIDVPEPGLPPNTIKSTPKATAFKICSFVANIPANR